MPEGSYMESQMQSRYDTYDDMQRELIQIGQREGIEGAVEVVKLGLENNKKMLKAALSRDQKIAVEGGIGACEGILDLLADLSESLNKEGE